MWKKMYESPRVNDGLEKKEGSGLLLFGAEDLGRFVPLGAIFDRRVPEFSDLKDPGADSAPPSSDA